MMMVMQYTNCVIKADNKVQTVKLKLY